MAGGLVLVVLGVFLILRTVTKDNSPGGGKNLAQHILSL